MFGTEFYFGTIRKYNMYFGAVFNDIYIERTLPDGSTGARIKVPLTISTKEKVLARLRQDPTANRPVDLVLPSMAFEMAGLRYNPSRKLPSVNKITAKSSDKSRMKYQYVPVPYDFSFNLYVQVKNAEDGTKIVEQILPRFTPEWSATLELIPEMGVKQAIPIVLNQVGMVPVFKDETYEEHRAYIWVLEFTMQGYIYGPVKENPIIKFSKANFSAGEENTSDPFLRITTTPGLTSNGQPTTNPDDSVDPLTIDVDDDWGFAESRENL